MAYVAAAPKPPPPPPPLTWNKIFLEFGRAYWPAFAVLEGLALIGATLNGILSRRRRVEIARLNAQLRSIMAKQADAETSRASEYSPVSEEMSAAKVALAAGDATTAATRFAKAIDLAKVKNDAAAELSAWKGLGMAQQSLKQLRNAAVTFETALELSKMLNGGGGAGDASGELKTK